MSSGSAAPNDRRSANDRQDGSVGLVMPNVAAACLACARNCSSVIAASLYERFESRDMGAFTGKVLSAMRSEFGGHAEKKA